MTMISGDIHWAYPCFALLLLTLPAAAYFARYLQSQKPGIQFSRHSLLQRISGDWNQYLRYIVSGLRILVLILLILILSRPQSEVRNVHHRLASIDIMLVLDLSESMRAQDIYPSRLIAVKRVLDSFIRRRSQDRLGLVVFSGTPFTVTPLTYDHEALIRELADANTHTVSIEGTALGDALLLGATRLVESGPEGFSQAETGKAKGSSPGKVIILATDGVNNRGVDPVVAARVLSKKGIKLYTIGLGSQKPVLRYARNARGKPVPQQDVYGRLQYWEHPDETMLQTIARLAQGNYFRANSQEKFNQALNEIDRLEKNKIVGSKPKVYQEKYLIFMLLALGFLLAEMVLRFIRFRTLA